MRPLRSRDFAVAQCLPAALLLLGISAARAAPTLEDSRLLAQLLPKRYTTVSAELPTSVESIAFREGESFRAGDVLFVLDCALQEAQKLRQEAELGAAAAKHRGNIELERLSAVGQVEFAESEAALAVARAELNYLEVTLEKCRATAPWDGAAGEWQVRPGAFVQTGQPVLDILETGSLQAEFIVPTSWLSWFRPGYEFALHVEELDRDIRLRLRRTAARADPVSQSVKAVADLLDGSDDLIAGMSGYLRLSPPGTPPSQR